MFKRPITMFKRYASSAARLADVVIIGGGPAGLTLAAALKNSRVTHNLRVELVEAGKLFEPLHQFRESAPESFTNRVVSLTPATVAYLQRIGAWDHVNFERVEEYDNILAYDGISNERVEFEHTEIATMCENANLQSALLSRIEELGNVSLNDSTKVVGIENDGPPAEGVHSDRWPVVRLDNGESIRTRLLVGADGFNSPVRNFAQIQSRGWSYERWGIVATLKYKVDSYRQVTGWQRFLPTGPIALLPMPEDSASLVWSTTPELAEKLLKMPEEEFVAMINAAMKLDQDELGFLYDLDDGSRLENVGWRLGLFNDKLSPEQEEFFPLEIASMVSGSRARFPLKMSHADTYVAPRIALVGDAAHTTHPLAGQGLNMGQGDVQSLVSCLETATERGLDIGSTLALEPYWSERWPINNAMLGVVDKLHKLYSTDFAPVVWARSVGLSLFNTVPFVKDFVVSQMSKK